MIQPAVWHPGPSEWPAPREMLEGLDLTEDERAVLGGHAPRMRFELEDIGC